MKNLCFSGCLLVSLIFVAAQVSEAAITCPTVANQAFSCVKFVTGKAPKPADACCAGLHMLAKSATTTVDRQNICRCLKAAVQNLAGVQDKYLSQVPASCGIKLGFPVSLKTNCDRIA
ncbi:non-specific lipid-transfer protein C, cotyledon-specific isoform-like [Aristolochia californica]|uniref:non-specific lipid-transfer protein C, cotyledon-specific isoform-like n=1 Tax=Aristolochia californica TaxID=171875 RepID=UPI0035E19D1E